MGLGRTGNGHGLGDEPVEERHARDGHGSDHVADHDQRQPRSQPAQLAELGRTGRKQQAANTHEQQALIQNVGIRVGAGSVHGHGRADADAADHVSDLRHDVVGQNAPGIVLDGGVKHAVETHDAAADGQHIKAGEAPGQNVDRGLRGKRAHKHGARDRGLRISVRQPGVQGYEGGVYKEADKNQVVVVVGGIG